jgi:ABC-2 type transport system ATP-binding protein
LASTIIHDPPVLILDEPSTGLDPTQIVQMRLLLRDLAQETPRDSSRAGRVVLLSSHILPEVEATADRIIMLARGQVRVDGDRYAIVKQHAQATSTSGLGCQVRVEFDLSLPADALDAACQQFSLAGFILQGSGAARTLSHPLHAADDATLRHAVASFAASKGILLTRLQAVQPTLEDVFARVTADTATQEAAA